MRWMEQLRMKAAMLLRRKSATVRLDQEIQFRLEQQVAENLAAGMEPAEARSAALRLFGNPASLRDETRSTWGWSWLEKTWRTFATVCEPYVAPPPSVSSRLL